MQRANRHKRVLDGGRTLSGAQNDRVPELIVEVPGELARRLVFVVVETSQFTGVAQRFCIDLPDFVGRVAIAIPSCRDA